MTAIARLRKYISEEKLDIYSRFRKQFYFWPSNKNLSQRDTQTFTAFWPFDIIIYDKSSYSLQIFCYTMIYHFKSSIMIRCVYSNQML